MQPHVCSQCSKLTMKVSNHIGNLAQGAELPTHEKTGLFFPQFLPVPGTLAGQFSLMLVPGSGIPMRDYFAAKIATNLMHDGYDSAHENFPAIARDAYRLADAMIVERSRTQANDQTSQFHEDYLK